jgi:polyhydroxyalkanoate synthase
MPANAVARINEARAAVPPSEPVVLEVVQDVVTESSTDVTLDPVEPETVPINLKVVQDVAVQATSSIPVTTDVAVEVESVPEAPEELENAPEPAVEAQPEPEPEMPADAPSDAAEGLAWLPSTASESEMDRLTDLTGVGDAMERRLKAAGYQTYQDLADADEARLQQLVGNKAAKIIKAARDKIAE